VAAGIPVTMWDLVGLLGVATADVEYELHYDSDGVLPNSFAAKNWLP
jgi:hypothetical protein